MKLHVKERSSQEIYRLLTSLVAPRPIALVSTIDRQGQVNLSPFSFFNVVSSDPPLVIFSPLRTTKDNHEKHTLQNIREVPEVVINIVSYEMVHQTSLASSNYPKKVDEFTKAGFIKEKPTMILPPMVKQSKVKLECEVIEIKSFGQNGGAGQLIIAEVLKIHIDDSIIDEQEKIDPAKLDLVCRMGEDWYARITKENLFRVPRPLKEPGIGIDHLPEYLKYSETLTGNDLAQLAGVVAIPAFDPEFTDERVEGINTYFPEERKKHTLESYAQQLIAEGEITSAWQVLIRVNETTKTQVHTKSTKQVL